VKRSNRLVIFVGVLLAILAFVGIVILLNSQNTGPTSGGQSLKVTVLIARQDIKIGDPVTPDKVQEVQVDPSGVSGTPIGSASAVAGQQSLFNVPKGSQVSQEDIGGGSGPTNHIAAQLKPGEKAIAFQVDAVTGINFLIVPGDHVDIVMSQKIPVVQITADTIDKPKAQQRFEAVSGLDQAPTVKTVLQNKRVLFVSQTNVRQATNPSSSASPAPSGQQPAQTATATAIIVIAGTDQDAEALKFAQNDAGSTGLLTAVLRNAQDMATEKTTGITLERLVAQYGLVIPNVIKLPVK
jgi:Flp pilus assembly protein CpaB